MLRYIVIAVIVLICIGFLIGYLLLKWKEDGAGIFEKKDGFQGDLADDDIEELERPMSWMLFITFPCVKVILTCPICRISGTKNLFSLCRENTNAGEKN